MKKLIALLMALVMVFALAACGETQKTPDDTQDTTGNTEPSATEEKPIYKEEQKFQVVYEGGADDVTGEGPAAKEVKDGDEIMLPDAGFERKGYTFGGWSDGQDVYQMADFYIVEQDTTFTAVWNEVPTYLDLGNMDAANGWEGFPDAMVSTDAPAEGNGYLTITGSEAIVYRNISTTYNLSSFMESGVVHISIYVEDPSVITGGQIEFSSSGGADINEISVGDFGSGLTLQAGWNTFDIPLAQFNEVGGACDTSAVNFIRVYFLTSAVVKTGIDHFYIDIP